MNTEFIALPHSTALKPFEGAQGIIITEYDSGDEAIVAQLYENYLNGENRIHQHAAMFTHSPKMLALLERAINVWPEFDNHQKVDGGYMVEWFAKFREDVKVLVADTKKAVQASITEAGIESLQNQRVTDETSELPVPNIHAKSTAS